MRRGSNLSITQVEKFNLDALFALFAVDRTATSYRKRKFCARCDAYTDVCTARRVAGDVMYRMGAYHTVTEAKQFERHLKFQADRGVLK